MKLRRTAGVMSGATGAVASLVWLESDALPRIVTLECGARSSIVLLEYGALTLIVVALEDGIADTAAARERIARGLRKYMLA